MRYKHCQELFQFILRTPKPCWSRTVAAGLLLGAAFSAFAGDAGTSDSDTVARVRARLGVISAYKSAKSESVRATRTQNAGSTAALPLWPYDLQAPRDGSFYSGVIVGNDPAGMAGTTRIPTYIVPLVLTTNTVVTGTNADGSFTERAHVSTTFDPSQPDVCLSVRQSVTSLLEQSPVFQNSSYDLGGTVLSPTQYVDAFQRSSFWGAIAKNNSNYHVLLSPVTVLPAVRISIPDSAGTAVPPDLADSCNWSGIIDVAWLDNYLDTVILPSLAARGVNPGTLPVFVTHNVSEATGDPATGPCCILGYHAASGQPIQTYAFVDFDTTQLFPSALQDSGILSHEIAEWMNDPFGTNAVPAWSHGGQQPDCQYNLEVGDPLTGIDPYRITGAAGFTYHLQELAGFSWFFGGPSTAIHGWYSNNGTYASDAGPVCESTSTPAADTPWHFHKLDPALPN